MFRYRFTWEAEISEDFQKFLEMNKLDYKPVCGNLIKFFWFLWLIQVEFQLCLVRYQNIFKTLCSIFFKISEKERREKAYSLADADDKMDRISVEITKYYKVKWHFLNRKLITKRNCCSLRKLNIQFKIPFMEALDLIRLRKVHLEKVWWGKFLVWNYFKFKIQATSYFHLFIVVLNQGYAYVPENKLVSVIGYCFRTHLSDALVVSDLKCAVYYTYNNINN